MIPSLMRLYRRFLAKSEQSREPDGYLSWRGEWHAAAWGLSVGILAAVTGMEIILALGVGWLFTSGIDGGIPGYVPYPGQFIKESLYVISHAVFGYVAVVLVGVL